MEGSITGRERRKYPRIVINLPLEYQEREEDPSLRGAMVVNVSKGGFLIESTRDMPVGTELSITLLYSREFELTSFKAVTKIVRKEPYSKENSNGNQVWEGYLYGLEFIQISDEDHRKLNWLLGDQFEFDETFLSLFCQP
jgi:c-di-GMP-binding flagellar brake protein YcgR